MKRVIYEVHLDVDPGLANDVKDFMERQHIPDVLATGCFISAAFAQNVERQYRTSYLALDRESLARYITEHSKGLREDFVSRFPTGVSVTRKEWTVLAELNP
ncbi:MAG TPA: DUF4286 family protein [Pyrinomonadaceae bacterium]|nr:DUF4286 family protein [Pyrinomonadaceae bacterium]